MRQQSLVPIYAFLASLLFVMPVHAEEPCTVTAIVPGGTVDIKGSGPEWRACLIEALSKRDTTVRLGPDVDMDMTGAVVNDVPISIVGGVTFTSVASFDQAPPPRRDVRRDVAAPTPKFSNRVRNALGNNARPEAAPPAAAVDPMIVRQYEARGPNSRGPRIFTRDKPKFLFQIRCFPDGPPFNDNVRISGFRLEGAEKSPDSTGSSIGIENRGCLNIVISNMEISGWSNAGIKTGDGNDTGRLVDRNYVHISDSYFHHNQHTGGFGYGINPSVAVIERNVFDFNRHAISTGGASGGYEASRNLVLKGGGYHGYAGLAYTHQFDVHGTEDCWGDANCGEAGSQLIFFENAFQYRHDHAIGLRGTPRISAVINRNVFAHEDVRDTTLAEGAVRLYTGDTRVTFGQGANANRGGVDTFGRYGVCDFDGDGKDDIFLPTGVTWWYIGAGRIQWTYLNALEGTIEQLRLGYFDDDARCDVMADNGREWLMSSGGRLPWSRFGDFGTRLVDVAFGRFDPSQRDQRANVTRKTTHAFRRTREGDWQVTPLAQANWQRVQHSAAPMNKLRFGDFTGDGVTDVLTVESGRWSISESARGPWTRLNPALGDDVATLLIADVDHNNRDDLIRFVSKPRGTPTGRQTWDVGWQVSYDGRTAWQTLQTYSFTFEKDEGTVYPAYGFAGRFDDDQGSDLVAIDPTRRGNFVNRRRTQWRSVYAY